MKQSPYISNRNRERMYRGGVWIGDNTLGNSSPGRSSRVGCLCKTKDIYSIKCCDKSLIAQGIGKTQKPAE
jgi:hypothetical protein